jgi:hypothetical protein
MRNRLRRSFQPISRSDGQLQSLGCMASGEWCSFGHRRASNSTAGAWAARRFQVIAVFTIDARLSMSRKGVQRFCEEDIANLKDRDALQCAVAAGRAAVAPPLKMITANIKTPANAMTDATATMGSSDGLPVSIR